MLLFFMHTGAHTGVFNYSGWLELELLGVM